MANMITMSMIAVVTRTVISRPWKVIQLQCGDVYTILSPTRTAEVERV